MLPGAQAVRWLKPRPPGERDLLSDFAAAVGLDEAVARLSRFWKRAEVAPVAVRTIDRVEAEVYERLTLPNEILSIVSLVRREDPSADWKVVCTSETDDDRFVFWIATPRETIDDVAWTREFQSRERGELLMTEETEGVLGHPDRGWLVNVRGPNVPAKWPDVLPGEGGRIVELTSALSSSVPERREQLRWVLRAARVFLDELEGQAALMPAYKKLVLSPALRAAAANQLTSSQAFRFWARIDETHEYFHTTGLRQLGLPEVEAAKSLVGDRERTARLVRWLGASLVDPRRSPTMGTELFVGEHTFLLAPGRRGPRAGKTYGRWGAIEIVSHSDEAPRTGSRTRIRVPDEFT